MAGSEVEGGGIPVELLARRSGALAALQDEPVETRELRDRLGVSRSTVHRIKKDLEGYGLVRREGRGLELTHVGEHAAEAVGSLGEVADALGRLFPFMHVVEGLPAGFDPTDWADAEVTVAREGKPYAPVRRFVELLGASETLRGYDTTSVAPFFVDEIRDAILEGTRTEVVFLPKVGEQVAAEYPERLREAAASENLEIRVDEDIPCGLTLLDDRTCLGGYDPQTGMLQAYVDTDADAAAAWAEEEFRRVWERAEPLELPG